MTTAKCPWRNYHSPAVKLTADRLGEMFAALTFSPQGARPLDPAITMTGGTYAVFQKRGFIGPDGQINHVEIAAAGDGLRGRGWRVLLRRARAFVRVYRRSGHARRQLGRRYDRAPAWSALSEAWAVAVGPPPGWLRRRVDTGVVT